MKHLKLFTILISLLFCLSSGTIKADTIYIQVPGGQTLCQDTNNFTTFVFYKPLGFGSTMWNINLVPYGSGDSLIFTPTAIGTYSIGASWNGNDEAASLQLFSTPPAHAQFELPWGGGSVNATNDTVWMCGTSVSVASNTIGSEATSYTWHGPGVNNSSDDPIPLTTPGTYYFERVNPCGIVRDTFELVSLPYTLPVFTDAVFCNTPVSLTLDPGPGWNYSWTPGGATTQTLFVDTAGTYTVNLTNLCTSGSASMTVEHQSFPQPDMLYLPGDVLCADSIVVMSPDQGGYLYDTYSWSNGATTPTISISGLSGGSGNYYVTVTQGSCSATTGFTLQFYQEPVQPEICIVTVDTATNKNMVVWTADYEPFPGCPQYAATASYNIYKAVGFNTWNLIGNVAVNQEHTFVDVNSNPASVSNLYKITMVDECGVESQKTFYHKTVLLSVTQGGNPGEIPLMWTSYVDESGLFQVDKYYIYRSSDSNNMQLYDSVPGYNTSYVDQNVFTQYYYLVGVSKYGGCDPSPAQGQPGTLREGSFSNKTMNVITGTQVRGFEEISVLPNPAHGYINFKTNIDNFTVDILNILGQVLIREKSKKTIDIQTLPAGTYFVKVKTGDAEYQQKIIVY